MLGLQRFGALRRRPGVDGVEQPLDMRQLLPRVGAQHIRRNARPAPDGHVHNCVVVSQHPRAISQAVVNQLPVPPGFEIVSVERIGLGLRRHVPEVHRLARVRPDAGGYKHQPRVHGRAGGGRVLGQEQAGLLGQVKQDGVAVEHNRVIIDQRRRLGVRVDRKKCGVVLLAATGVDRHHFVRQRGLFQEQGNLGGVGRRVVVELDQRVLLKRWKEPARTGLRSHRPRGRRPCWDVDRVAPRDPTPQGGRQRQCAYLPHALR